MQTHVLAQPDPKDEAAVRALAAAAERADGVAALSEQTLLHLAGEAGEHRHVLVEHDGHLLGYGHLDHTGEAPGAEIVVAPDGRRRGVGTALWTALTSLAPGARVWAHGDLPSARGFASSAGLHVVRELLRLARPLDGLADVEVDLPGGYTVRGFTPEDIDEWVAINGRAFATHPEQGRVTADDVRDRMAEPWFDADGFLLVHRGDGALAAFHWTKTEGGEGEVYVVGVDPDLHGRGLGRSTTLLGLRHLARSGLPRVTLYVDGDNAAALATYRRLGFERDALDVMYG